MKEDIQAQPSRQPVTEEHDWNTYEDMLKAAFQGLIKCKNKQDSELQSCRERYYQEPFVISVTPTGVTIFTFLYFGFIFKFEDILQR